MYFKELLTLSFMQNSKVFIYDFDKFNYYDFDIDLKDNCLICDFNNNCYFYNLAQSIKDLFYKRVEDLKIINIDVIEVYLCFG